MLSCSILQFDAVILLYTARECPHTRHQPHSANMTTTKWESKSFSFLFCVRINRAHKMIDFVQSLRTKLAVRYVALYLVPQDYCWWDVHPANFSTAYPHRTYLGGLEPIPVDFGWEAWYTPELVTSQSQGLERYFLISTPIASFGSCEIRLGKRLHLCTDLHKGMSLYLTMSYSLTGRGWITAQSLQAALAHMKR